MFKLTFKRDENYFLIYQKRAEEERFFTEVLKGQAPFFFLFATEIMLELMGKDRHFEINKRSLARRDFF